MSGFLQLLLKKLIQSLMSKILFTLFFESCQGKGGNQGVVVQFEWIAP